MICLGLLLLMIFASGYLFIYNALYISVSKDIRFYGQLKTVGMTSVQLKKTVWLQSLWNAAAGIPLGILSAAVVSKLVIPGILSTVNPELPAEDFAAVPLWVFFLAAGFAFFTNLVSCRKPVKWQGSAPRWKPCAIRQYLPKKERADGKQAAQERWLFQNLFRDKKQAFIIFISFIIALSVFLVVNEVIRENDAKLILNETSSYDIRFKNETTLDEIRKPLLTEEKIERVRKIPGVREVRKVTSTEIVVPYQEAVYGRYYKELYQSRYSPGNYANVR